MKLNFLKIEFQNMSILLNSFRTWTFCYIFWVKGANVHFGLSIEDFLDFRRYHITLICVSFRSIYFVSSPLKCNRVTLALTSVAKEIKKTII